MRHRASGGLAVGLRELLLAVVGEDIGRYHTEGPPLTNFADFSRLVSIMHHAINIVIS